MVVCYSSLNGLRQSPAPCPVGTWGEVVWEVSCRGCTLINTESTRNVTESLRNYNTERDRGCDKLTAKMVMLLLLLSRFSRVRLCETPYTAANQAPPSLGFSRQEHWSGVPFPSPMHENEKWKWSHSVVSDSLWPHGLLPGSSTRGIFQARVLEWGAIAFSKKWSFTYAMCLCCSEHRGCFISWSLNLYRHVPWMDQQNVAEVMWCLSSD